MNLNRDRAKGWIMRGDNGLAALPNRSRNLPEKPVGERGDKQCPSGHSDTPQLKQSIDPGVLEQQGGG